MKRRRWPGWVVCRLCRMEAAIFLLGSHPSPPGRLCKAGTGLLLSWGLQEVSFHSGTGAKQGVPAVGFLSVYLRA